MPELTAAAVWEALAEIPDPEIPVVSLVELRFVPDWARTIARRVLYEEFDAQRLQRLMASGDPAVAGLAAKIDREEAYHRVHAEMWRERLRDEPRYREAVDELWPYAVAMADPEDHERLSALFERKIPSNTLLLGKAHGDHVDGWPALWEEMTEVRRSVPGATW